MPIFEDDTDFPIPTWTNDDVEVLDSIDDDLIFGISNLLKFIVHEQGVVHDQTLDLALVFHSIVNSGTETYSFDQAETVVSVASEFCLIDCVFENQVLSMVEVRDNAVLFFAIHDEFDYALEAAVCLSSRSDSLLSNISTRPSLSLFGSWEAFATVLLYSLLTEGKLSGSISLLMKKAKTHGLEIDSTLSFVDSIRKLSAAGLFSVNISKREKAVVSINKQPAGLFLLFCGETELARKLAEL
jgi:hypothetical protein